MHVIGHCTSSIVSVETLAGGRFWYHFGNCESHPRPLRRSSLAVFRGRTSLLASKTKSHQPSNGQRRLCAGRPQAVHQEIGPPWNQDGQPFQRVALLTDVLMPIVYAPHTRNFVTQHALGDIGRYTGPRHQRTSGPS